MKVFGDELRRWDSGHPKGRLDKRGHTEDVWCPSCTGYQIIHQYIIWIGERGLCFTQCHACDAMHLISRPQQEMAFNKSRKFWEYVKAGGDDVPQA